MILRSADLILALAIAAFAVSFASYRALVRAATDPESEEVVRTWGAGVDPRHLKAGARSLRGVGRLSRIIGVLAFVAWSYLRNAG